MRVRRISRLRGSAQGVFPIAAGRKETQDRYALVVDEERYGQPSLEADDTKSLANIATGPPTFRRQIEAEAKVLDALDISERCLGSRGFRDMIVNRDEIGARFWRENDLAFSHLPPFDIAA